MKKTLFAIFALLGAVGLTGCGQTGPIPTFGKPITPQWIKADFDGQPGDEYIVTNNLQDVVFNDRGEILGWYVKSYAGTPFIKKNRDGSYNFEALKSQKAIINMVDGHHYDFKTSRKALVIEAEGLDSKQNAAVKPPVLSTDEKANQHQAVFEYTQHGVTVVKKITLRPRSFLIDLDTEVSGGPEQVKLLLPGLAKANAPRIQAIGQGSGQPSAVQGQGQLSVEAIQYAALQENPSQIAHAIILKPLNQTPVNVALQGEDDKAQITAQLPAKSQVQIYGGKNELIHLYQSGYSQLPGLFQPNFFGKISLSVVKVMELLYSSIKNWGLVILALTILLRLVMWPLMQTQGRTTARMQYIQPKIKEIQERYAGRKDLESQRAMQAEVGQLYRDHNVNPAGCLSTFLPFPILIALWSTIRNFEFDSGFLWLPDLAVPDPWYMLAMIYMVVNLVQLYISTRKTPEMFRQQAMIYMIFLYFGLTFPSGVTIYAILSGIIGIVQQFLINKQVEQEVAAMGQRVEKVANNKPPAAKPKKTLDAPGKEQNSSKRK